MATLTRATTPAIRPLGLVLLGAAGALVVLLATSAARSSWSAVVLFLVAGVVLAMLPVRLPGGAVSLLSAVLIPTWLVAGPVATAAVAAASILVSSAVRGVGLLTTILRTATVLAGVFLGHLFAFGVLALSLIHI